MKSHHSPKSKEKELLAAREYYYANKDRVLAMALKRYAENKEAIKKKTGEYYLSNKEKASAKMAEYRAKNRDEVLARKRKHYAANKDRLLEQMAEYKKRNPEKCNALKAKRKARKLMATPAWADLDAIKDVYKEAAYMQMHVDHIVPLQSKLVCGLHVWDNLQILDGSANSRKHNKFCPDGGIWK